MIMSWSKRERGLGTALIFITLLFSLHFFSSSNEQLVMMEFPEEEIEAVSLETDKLDEPVRTTIMVDIKGAVSSPGVYEMEEGERVKDVITKAGGLLSHADERQINLAQLVHDEMIVYISSNDEINSEKGSLMPESQESSKVSINRADSQELQTLPGIGPSKAEAIIAYRTENGPFKKTEELVNVAGIGEKSFEKLKDKIRTN
jgi:competence protein ComEA